LRIYHENVFNHIAASSAITDDANLYIMLQLNSNLTQKSSYMGMI